ncbi:PAS domain-containing protein [Pseudidiomarina sp. E22-M8]|uniref:PAS domain-containing protein n=1 Tax=Pseudidiomarina sp. E22-M8 TaxID=3424768 RepID=UPI00403CAD51
MLALVSGNKSFAKITTLLTCLFVVAGYFVSPPAPEGFGAWFVIANRVGAVVAIALLYAIYGYFNTKLKKSRDFASMSESLPIQIWTATPAGEVNYVGDKLAEFTGKKKSEILVDWLAILHPDDREHTVAIWTEAITSSNKYEVEFRLRRQDGTFIWHLTEAVPERDAKGNITRWIGSSIDINHLKDVKKEVRVALERFDLMSKATNDAIWDWDFGSGRVFWNESFEEMFGYDRNNLEPGPESWSNRIHPDDLESVLDSIHKAIEGDASRWQMEYRFMHAKGKPLQVMDRGFIARDTHGKATRMVGSMMNLTERKQLEERLRQSQKLESVGQLTGGVAHDFNNLLTVILGNAELLELRLADNTELCKLAAMTVSAAERGAELTNRLLAFARRQPLEPKPLLVTTLLNEIEDLLRRTLIESVDLQVVHAPDLAFCEVDPNQLEASLLNLCINARDAMPNGGSIVIETKNVCLDDKYSSENEDVKPGNYIMVSVSDTGFGMDDEVISRAFEPFFTTKEMGEGSGLGLSMIYGFVKQSGGHAKIYSERGEGTSVKLYFPTSAESSEVLDKAEPIEVASSSGTERILVVEDDDLVRENLVRQLESLGYQVCQATDGSSALKWFTQGDKFDLLFTDVIMPGGMNGPELAKRAQQIDSKLKVLFTSGYTENAIVHHGRLDDGVHLLSKPYRIREMAEKVRDALR